MIKLKKRKYLNRIFYEDKISLKQGQYFLNGNLRKACSSTKNNRRNGIDIIIDMWS